MGAREELAEALVELTVTRGISWTAVALATAGGGALIAAGTWPVLSAVAAAGVGAAAIDMVLDTLLRWHIDESKARELIVNLKSLETGGVQVPLAMVPSEGILPELRKEIGQEAKTFAVGAGAGALIIGYLVFGRDK